MRRLKFKGFFKKMKDEVHQDEEDVNIRNMDGFEEEKEAESVLTKQEEEGDDE